MAELKGIHYLLVLNYFSRFVRIAKLSSTTFFSVIYLHLNQSFQDMVYPQNLLVTMDCNMLPKSLMNFQIFTISVIQQAAHITHRVTD